VPIPAGCPNGHPVRSGARFCPHCGEPYVSQAPEDDELGANGPNRHKAVLGAAIFVTIGAVVAVVALVLVHNNGGPSAVASGGTTNASAVTTAAPVTSATTNPAPPTTAASVATTPADYSPTPYTSASFSINYPSGWTVVHLPLQGGNLDTTFQPTASWNGWLIRVDEDPHSGGTLNAASDPEIAELERDPSYALISLTRTTFAGVAALRWEFEDTEAGIRLHKVDTFFIDADGNGWGVLVQAPQSAWPAESAALEDYQASFSDLATS
jgi:hypothetical protein